MKGEVYLKRTYVMPLLVLTIICLVVSGALAYMNSITSPVISEAAKNRKLEVMRVKIPDALDFEEINLQYIEGLPASIREIYRTTNGIGYIFVAARSGFSGDITVICAIDPEGNIISASTLSHTETKGIGTIIEEDRFLGLFTGKDDQLEGVDTIAGATISTKAYIQTIGDIMVAFHLVDSQIN